MGSGVRIASGSAKEMCMVFSWSRESSLAEAEQIAEIRNGKHGSCLQMLGLGEY